MLVEDDDADRDADRRVHALEDPALGKARVRRWPTKMYATQAPAPTTESPTPSAAKLADQGAAISTTPTPARPAAASWAGVRDRTAASPIGPIRMIVLTALKSISVTAT